MSKITEEELTLASKTWQQTYMSIMVSVGVARSVETNHDKTPSINAPLVTTKNIWPPFGCKLVREMVESLPGNSCWVHAIM